MGLMLELAHHVQFSSVQFSSGQFSSVQVSSVQFSSVQLLPVHACSNRPHRIALQRGKALWGIKLQHRPQEMWTGIV